MIGKPSRSEQSDDTDSLEGVTASLEGVSVPPGGLVYVEPFKNRSQFEAWLDGFEQAANATKGSDAVEIQRICAALRACKELPREIEIARLGYLLGQYHAQLIRRSADKHRKSRPRSPGKHVINRILEQNPAADFSAINKKIRSHRGRNLYGVHVTEVGQNLLLSGQPYTRESLKVIVSRCKKTR